MFTFNQLFFKKYKMKQLILKSQEKKFFEIKIFQSTSWPQVDKKI